MKLNNTKIYTIVVGVGFISGYGLSGSPIGGIVFALLFVFIAGSFSTVMGKKTVLQEKWEAYNEFTHVIILFASAIIKADGKINQRELDIVEERLARDFSPQKVRQYMKNLNVCLGKSVRIDAVCNKIKHQLDHPTKIQLIHFLTAIAVSNGRLIDSEYKLLRSIALGINLPDKSFQSVLAMFNFQRESYQRSYQRPTGNTTGYKLKQAYRILEITETASDQDIKKAYRKLAKVHHPDRVIHLGEEFQKIAKEKFQKLSDAYELVKEKRGIA